MSLFRRTLVGLCCLAGLAFLVPSASSAVEIHAHRGGANVDGVAAFPENSLPAFEHSLAEHWVIELDLQVTSDGVPVVMHDETLNRTTTCAGNVDAFTLAALAACKLDVLGFGEGIRTPIAAENQVPVPTFAQVITLLENTDGKANIEVKDLAGEHPESVTKAYTMLEDSKIPSSKVILQNFKPADLSSAKSLYPGVATSLLSLNFLNDSFLIQTAEAQGIDWVSPGWPISAEFVSRARAAGKLIVPYTIDDAVGINEAAALEVEAIISNDPTLADRLVGDRAALSIKPPRGVAKVKPGKTIKLPVTISNIGDGFSEDLKLTIDFKRTALRPVGPVSKAIGFLAPGEKRGLSTFKVKVKRKTTKFKAFPLKFTLTEAGRGSVSAFRTVRVVRPRK